MIVVDYRTGSKELAAPLRGYGIDIEVDTLEYGDVWFCGNGPDGVGTAAVGIERKRMGDLVDSMRSKRLSGHQLPGLLRTYNFVYLLVEGLWKVGIDGKIQLFNNKYRKWFNMLAGSRPVTFIEVDHYLATLGHVCGVQVMYTATIEHTVSQIVSRYRWWNDKLWEKHDSHNQIYAHYEPAGRNRIARRSIGIVEKMAAQIYGIDKKAFDVGKRFRTPFEMVAGRAATVDDRVRVGDKWDKVVGKKLRDKVVGQLLGGAK